MTLDRKISIKLDIYANSGFDNDLDKSIFNCYISSIANKDLNIDRIEIVSIKINKRRLVSTSTQNKNKTSKL
ncbi:unnamed protein product [Rotaria socialis]